MKFGPVTPLLRFYDDAATREFYIDYLGFAIDFEHRFDPDLPLYMQISRGDCRLHLTQHHGDCSPGAAVRIACDDVHALHAELKAKTYNFLRPGVESQPWSVAEMTLTDPAGNRLTFVQAREAED